MEKEENLEATYCPICYTNEIIDESQPLDPNKNYDTKATAEFDCTHRFCLECVIEQLK